MFVCVRSSTRAPCGACPVRAMSLTQSNDVAIISSRTRRTHMYTHCACTHARVHLHASTFSQAHFDYISTIGFIQNKGNQTRTQGKRRGKTTTSFIKNRGESEVHAGGIRGETGVPLGESSLSEPAETLIKPRLPGVNRCML